MPKPVYIMQRIGNNSMACTDYHITEQISPSPHYRIHSHIHESSEAH